MGRIVRFDKAEIVEFSGAIVVGPDFDELGTGFGLGDFPLLCEVEQSVVFCSFEVEKEGEAEEEGFY